MVFIGMQLHFWVCTVPCPSVQAWERGSCGFSKVRNWAQIQFLFHHAAGFRQGAGTFSPSVQWVESHMGVSHVKECRAWEPLRPGVWRNSGGRARDRESFSLSGRLNIQVPGAPSGHVYSGL